MKEIWKPVKNYEGFYEVSNFGKVRSLDRVFPTKKGVVKCTKGKVMNLTLKDNGYKTVMLSVGGESKRFHVHRLVSEAFIYNSSRKPIVNHKNGIKADNNVKNLEWVTHRENVEHALKNNLTPVGMQCKYSKLTDEKILAIKRLYRLNPNFSKIKIAKKLKISDSTVHKIIRNKRWKHINL